jgi:hypothetical protein
MRRGAANWKRKARDVANTDVLVANGDAHHILSCRSKIIRVTENRVTGLVARAVPNITQNE